MTSEVRFVYVLAWKQDSLFFKDDGCTAAILLLMAGRCRDVCLAAEGGYVFVCTD